MDRVDVNTAELTDRALDWAVCVAHLGLELIETSDYSVDWAMGGPLIDEYDIALQGGVFEGERGVFAMVCGAPDGSPSSFVFGKTNLIAACRAVVSAYLGETVSVPSVLVRG